MKSLLIILNVVFALTIVFLIIYSRLKVNEAEDCRQLAQRQKAEAERQREIAIQQEAKAIQSENRVVLLLKETEKFKSQLENCK